MDYISLLTAIARVFILIPLLMFFWRQSHIFAKNGDTGRVRLATLLLAVFLVLMFGNLIYVNMYSSLHNSAASPITWAKYVALVTSIGLAGCLWHTWFLFRRIQGGSHDAPRVS